MPSSLDLGNPSTEDNPLPSTNVIPHPDTALRTLAGITMNVLDLKAYLGKGVFAKVALVQMKQSKKYYVCKIFNKAHLAENNEIEMLRIEEQVYTLGVHPFLCRLFAAFQTDSEAHFLLDYITGGDLSFHIQKGQFEFEHGQFYAAEICLALKYLHGKGVLYRNLSLENVLLDGDGHVKIVGFGLSKPEMWYGCTTKSFCGTAEFMAPEILLDKEYGLALDWWAFGIILYEMLLQQVPFRGKDEDEIYNAILADEPLYPESLSRVAVSIMQQLLMKDPDLRLGNGSSDAIEIMSHPFFKDIDWDAVYRKDLSPPFVPISRFQTDTSTCDFPEKFMGKCRVLTPADSSRTQAMQEQFRGFSYIADDIQL